MLAPSRSTQHRQKIAAAPDTASLRRRPAPVEEESNWWSITFSDLVLLLLCFVVLWHIADKRRAQMLARSPRDSDSSLSRRTSTGRGGSAVRVRGGVRPRLSHRNRPNLQLS